MSFKNQPYWLRGGILGAIIGFLIGIFEIAIEYYNISLGYTQYILFKIYQIPYLVSIYFFPWICKSGEVFSCLLIRIIVLVIFITLWLAIIGALIGLIIQLIIKIKNRKKKNSKK